MKFNFQILDFKFLNSITSKIADLDLKDICISKILKRIKNEFPLDEIYLAKIHPFIDSIKKGPKAL